MLWVVINTTHTTFNIEGQTLCYGKPTQSHSKDTMWCVDMPSLAIPTWNQVEDEYVFIKCDRYNGAK